MIEFGKTLQTAREAKGYSVSQLAEITHILPQIVENLEKEDFTRIVAPIYGRGFVKLYCEAVGIDSKPLVAEFMEIYNGNRPPVIRLKEPDTRASASSASETPVSDPVPPMPAPLTETAPVVEAPPPVQPMLGETPSEPRTRPEPTPAAFDFDPPLPTPPPANDKPLQQPEHEPESFKPALDDLPLPPPEEPATPKRDYRLPGYSMPEVPRQFWRFGILLAAAAVIIALAALCCRALYRATMTAPRAGEETAEVEPANADNVQKQEPQTTNGKTHNVNRLPRKGVQVPPLYID